MIYLMRHGQTVWNAERRYQGWQDSGLTDRGEAQARAAGRLLKDLVADIGRLDVVCSPLGRAVATMRLAIGELDLAPSVIRTDDRLKEVSLGAWEGILDKDVARRWPDELAARRADPWTAAPPGGENLSAVSDRVGAWLSERDETGPLLVVTHGVAGKVLRGLYLGLKRDEIVSLPTFGQDELHVLAGGISQTHETLAIS